MNTTTNATITNTNAIDTAASIEYPLRIQPFDSRGQQINLVHLRLPQQLPIPVYAMLADVARRAKRHAQPVSGTPAHACVLSQMMDMHAHSLAAQQVAQHARKFCDACQVGCFLLAHQNGMSLVMSSTRFSVFCSSRSFGSFR